MVILYNALTKSFSLTEIQEDVKQIKLKSTKLKSMLPPILLKLMSLAEKSSVKSRNFGHNSDDYLPEFYLVASDDNLADIMTWINNNYNYNDFDPSMHVKGTTVKFISCNPSTNYGIYYDFRYKNIRVGNHVVRNIDEIKSRLKTYYKREIALLKLNENDPCVKWVDWLIGELDKL